mgnify:FL=1|jgi:hypothetical protein
MEFDAEVPLEGEETREDTPEDAEAGEEGALDEEVAPSEVNTIAYQNILDQIDEERAARATLSSQI